MYLTIIRIELMFYCNFTQKKYCLKIKKILLITSDAFIMIFIRELFLTMIRHVQPRYVDIRVEKGFGIVVIFQYCSARM